MTEYSNTIIEHAHNSPEDIRHHTAVAFSSDLSARDTCGNGTNAFQFLSPKIRWAESSFPIRVFIDVTGNEVGDGITAAVQEALDEWDSRHGKQMFQLTTNRAEAKIIIGWDDLGGPSGTVAQASYNWNSRNEITRVTIDMDTSENWTIMNQQVCGSLGNAFDFQNVLTHELGHAVGFDHNQDPLSCMYPSTRFGETLRRTLSNGDELGFLQLYEIDEPPPPPPPPCPEGQHRDPVTGICVPDTPPPPPPPPSTSRPKIIMQSGTAYLNVAYENISGRFLNIKNLPFGGPHAKVITESGKQYVYLYYYRAANVFTTLGRIPLQ